MASKHWTPPFPMVGDVHIITSHNCPGLQPCRIVKRSLHLFPFSPIVRTLFPPFCRFQYSALLFRDNLYLSVLS